MNDAGMLVNEQRYFGLDSPRGSRWYNFDPLGFLECGVQGTFGGWQEGDTTGRDYVPGPVAVLNELGGISSVDPRELEEPVVGIAIVDWETFAEFLRAGQAYE